MRCLARSSLRISFLRKREPTIRWAPDTHALFQLTRQSARTHARTRFTTLSSFSMSSDIHDLSTRRSSARLQLSTLVAISRALSSSCITTAALSAAHSSVYLALTAAFTVLLISWFLFAHLSIVRFPARFPNTLSPLSVLFVRSQGLRSLPRGTLTLPRALATRCSSCHHDHAYAHATL